MTNSSSNGTSGGVGFASVPILSAPYGCDDCSAADGEPHRYAGCPGNVRQLEREAGR